MKKFLRLFILFIALVGASYNASASPCTTSNLIFTVKTYVSNGNGTYKVIFDIGWDQANNGGYNFSAAHLWQAGGYPSYAYSSPGGARPTASYINNSNALGSVVLSRNNNKSSWGFSTYPDGAITLLKGTLSTTSINNGEGTRFFISDVTITVNVPQESFSVKGDIWGSQSGNNVSCHDANKTFLPPLADFNVTGSLVCAYKDGLPENNFSVEMYSNALESNAYTVNYSVFIDNNSTASSGYVAGTEILVPNRSVTNVRVYTGNQYTSGDLNYLSSFNAESQYLYRSRNVYAVVVASYTENGGGQFTRILTLSNNCQSNPVPTPIAADDNFPQTVLNIIKGNVFGNTARWINELGSESEFTLSAPGGIDNDDTDPALGSLTFTKVGVTVYNGCTITVPQDLLKFYPNGTFEINRGELSCLEQVVFKYQVTNNITGITSGVATVTLEFAPQAPMPVTYKSFSANRTSNNQVVLEWVTAMEENNRGFHVQRNVDGTWKNVGFVFTQADGGNSTSELKYAFKDANSSQGISQYRVLQVDVDGKGRYSDVRSVRGEQTTARITVYPNPSQTGSFSILFEEGNSVRNVVVSDVSGRQVKIFQNITGNALKVDGLIDGFYTVQVSNRITGAIHTEKVIVKKR